MKTVTAEKLTQCYVELFPDELISPNNTPEQCIEQIIPVMSNWLKGYHTNPSNSIRASNWYGKVTKALFKALEIKQPKTVKDMLIALQD
jgi:hypothetical protein